MSIEEIIKVLEQERACVARQGEEWCDRDCARCDLVMDDKVILEAYDAVIALLRTHPDAQPNEPLTLEELVAYRATKLTPDDLKEFAPFLDEMRKSLGAMRRLKELTEAERAGRLVVLPCKVGDTVYRIIDDCILAGNCGTKRKCRGCDYRNVFVEEDSFCLSLIGNDGRLKSGYYLTHQEAEAAVEGKEENT